MHLCTTCLPTLGLSSASTYIAMSTLAPTVYAPSAKRRRLSSISDDAMFSWLDVSAELDLLRLRIEKLEHIAISRTQSACWNSQTEMLEERVRSIRTQTPSTNPEHLTQKLKNRIEELENTVGVSYLKKAAVCRSDCCGNKYLCPIEGCEHVFAQFRDLTKHLDKFGKPKRCSGGGHYAVFRILQTCRQVPKSQIQGLFWASLNLAMPTSLDEDERDNYVESDSSVAKTVGSHSSDTSHFSAQHLQNSDNGASSELDSTAILVPESDQVPKKQTASHLNYLPTNTQNCLDDSTGGVHNTQAHDFSVHASDIGDQPVVASNQETRGSTAEEDMLNHPSALYQDFPLGPTPSELITNVSVEGGLVSYNTNTRSIANPSDFAPDISYRESFDIGYPVLSEMPTNISNEGTVGSTSDSLLGGNVACNPGIIGGRVLLLEPFDARQATEADGTFWTTPEFIRDCENMQLRFLL